MSASVSVLGDSGWLSHIQSILAGVAWIAARVAMESASVLVHCRLAIYVIRQRCICFKQAHLFTSGKLTILSRLFVIS